MSEARDFYRWNLRVSGPQAQYVIYGFFAGSGPESARAGHREAFIMLQALKV